MKFGIHYAYWQRQWDADLVKYCRKAAEIGFDLFEISGGSLLDSSESQLKELKSAADALGIGINPCHGMPKDCDPGSENPADRQRGIDMAKRLFDRMGLIGSKQLGGTTYSYWPTFDFSNSKTDIAKARAYSLESMAVIADEAKKHGITLALEVVNRFENFLFNDVKGALEYLDALNRDNLTLLLDTFHMNIEEDYLGDAIRRAGSKLGHLHIGECNRKTPGSGHMPWDDIAQGLWDIGYNGGVVMEPFVQSGGEVADAIRVWRDLADPQESQLDSNLKTALAFVKSKFEMCKV